MGQCAECLKNQASAWFAQKIVIFEKFIAI